MTKGLSDDDRALWSRVTKSVTPLGQAPVSPAKGQGFFGVVETRSRGFDPRVDLHGLTVHAAFGVVREHIYQGVQNGYSKLLVITGRSGQINEELPRWLEGHPSVRSVKLLANGGSWEVLIKPAT
jgi:DNA-nicking Smr family endonuclease